jgi:bacteriorhodopsin
MFTSTFASALASESNFCSVTFRIVLYILEHIKNLPAIRNFCIANGWCTCSASPTAHALLYDSAPSVIKPSLGLWCLYYFCWQTVQGGLGYVRLGQTGLGKGNLLEVFYKWISSFRFSHVADASAPTGTLSSLYFLTYHKVSVGTNIDAEIGTFF